MTLYATLGLLSGVIVASCAVPYVYSILAGKTTPHPITWILWAFMGGLSLFFYWELGARDTIWIAVVNFVGPFIAAALSFRYWNWKDGFNVFEYACLAFSIVSIVIWIVSRDPVLALTFNIIADMFAALPTLVKVYKQPETESTWSWGVASVGAALSLVAIREWNYGVAVLPLYLFVLYAALAILSLRQKTGVPLYPRRLG